MSSNQKNSIPPSYVDINLGSTPGDIESSRRDSFESEGFPNNNSGSPDNERSSVLFDAQNFASAVEDSFLTDSQIDKRDLLGPDEFIPAQLPPDDLSFEKLEKEGKLRYFPANWLQNFRSWLNNWG